jgi:ribosome-associated toxin RatA of RatAB toxin-antitoxin module
MASRAHFLSFVASTWLFFNALGGPVAAALATPRPLQPFPALLLARYAPILLRSEIAIVETDGSGWARQITLLGYTPAPPAVVYQLVADPKLYPRYVRNMTRSDVEPQPDGALINRWKLSFPIGSFEGSDEIRPIPAAPGAAAGAVEMRSLGAGKNGHTRWEFLRVEGGGTLVVNYGYYDPLDVGILRVMIGKDPAVDAGFNLAGGLAVMRSLLGEAGRVAASQKGADASVKHSAAAAAPDLEPLLLRGTVAIVRSNPQGRLVDVSVVERIPRAAPLIADMVRAPEQWPNFLRMVRRVDVTQREPRGIEYDMTVAAPFMDLQTSFRMLFVPGGADSLAIGGAAKGARIRWDIRPDGRGAGSVAVWRGNLHIADTNRLLQAMLRIEPSFEHSANITVGLISVRSLARQASSVQ